MILLLIIYAIGVFLAYVMQRTEMESEAELYSKGARALLITFSLLSFIWIFIMLIRSWVKMIGLTGYWNRPVKANLVTPEKTDT